MLLGFIDDKVELYSPLPRAECIKRLDTAFISFWVSFGLRNTIDNASTSHFSAGVRIRYRNSFQTTMYAKLADDGQGTRIVCRFGMNAFVRLFLLFWFGGLASVAVAIVLSAASLFGLQSDNAPHPLVGIAGCTLLFALGLGLVRFGRNLANDEQNDLMSFVCRTVDASARPSPY